MKKLLALLVCGLFVFSVDAAATRSGRNYGLPAARRTSQSPAPRARRAPVAAAPAAVVAPVAQVAPAVSKIQQIKDAAAKVAKIGKDAFNNCNTSVKVAVGTGLVAGIAFNSLPLAATVGAVALASPYLKPAKAFVMFPFDHKKMTAAAALAGTFLAYKGSRLMHLVRTNCDDKQPCFPVAGGLTLTVAAGVLVSYAYSWGKAVVEAATPKKPQVVAPEEAQVTAK
jgi:hypothetical protein